MTVAEMGGKNPVLVFRDAESDVYQRLRDRLVEGPASLCAGPEDHPGTAVTPLIDEQARDRVLAAPASIRRAGSTLPSATAAERMNRHSSRR